MSCVISVVLLVLFLASLSSLIGFITLGMLPRFQQLDGLTWNIIGPSMETMLYGIKYQLSVCLLSIVAYFTFLYWLAKSPQRIFRRINLATNIFVLIPSILLLYFMSEPQGQVRLLGQQLVERDIDVDIAMDIENYDKEDQIVFFKRYDTKLAANNGFHKNYEEIYHQLKNKNVIFLVLESVRAKDFAAYGGDLDMPNFDKLIENSIIFKNMYSQDTRSTKAYASLDMGLFSLTSWDSYPSKLADKYTEISLAQLANEEGYYTSHFTNGSGNYDNHERFSENRGYQTIRYRESLNISRHKANDFMLLKKFEKDIQQNKKPFYSMLWPILNHHPYGFDFWKDRKNWLTEHPEGTNWFGKHNYPRYRQSLKDIDKFIGRLVKLLKRQKLYEDTVLIIVGDHGEAFGDLHIFNVIHGNNLFEESIHVPAIVHNPNINKTNVDNRFLPHRDLSATIYHLINENKTTLNNARSVFLDYKHNIPLYLSHTGQNIKGIIHDGYKLRVESDNKLFFSSINEIRADNRNELHQISVLEGKSKQLYHLLVEWSAAMKFTSLAVLQDTEPGTQDTAKDVLKQSQTRN